MTSLAGPQEVGSAINGAPPEIGHAVRKVPPPRVSCTEVSGVRRKRLLRLPRGEAGQHGTVRAGEARRPGRAWGSGGVATEAWALTACLSSPQSRHQKRARAQAQLRNLEAYAAQPHSFVFTRGRAGRSVRQLSLDVRRVMEPLTATRLQVCIPQPFLSRLGARHLGEDLGPEVDG